jgi:hypothetical protein
MARHLSLPTAVSRGIASGGALPNAPRTTPLPRRGVSTSGTHEKSKRLRLQAGSPNHSSVRGLFVKPETTSDPLKESGYPASLWTDKHTVRRLKGHSLRTLEPHHYHYHYHPRHFSKEVKLATHVVPTRGRNAAIYQCPTSQDATTIPKMVAKRKGQIGRKRCPSGALSLETNDHRRL